MGNSSNSVCSDITIISSYVTRSLILNSYWISLGLRKVVLIELLGLDLHLLVVYLLIIMVFKRSLSLTFNGLVLLRLVLSSLTGSKTLCLILGLDFDLDLGFTVF